MGIDNGQKKGSGMATEQSNEGNPQKQKRVLLIAGACLFGGRFFGVDCFSPRKIEPVRNGGERINWYSPYREQKSNRGGDDERGDTCFCIWGHRN